jgi:cytochrome o ubiquinol oxidase operon protein cyoD
MTLRNYITGFGLSLALTAAAFGLVLWHLHSEHEFPPHEVVVPTLLLLAVVQLVVQLVCFLHIKEEGKGRWNVVALGFALFIVFVVVGGSLWIMHNLQSMEGHDIEHEIFHDENIMPHEHHEHS